MKTNKRLAPKKRLGAKNRGKCGFMIKEWSNTNRVGIRPKCKRHGYVHGCIGEKCELWEGK